MSWSEALEALPHPDFLTFVRGQGFVAVAVALFLGGFGGFAVLVRRGPWRLGPMLLPVALLAVATLALVEAAWSFSADFPPLRLDGERLHAGGASLVVDGTTTMALEGDAGELQPGLLALPGVPFVRGRPELVLRHGADELRVRPIAYGPSAIHGPAGSQAGTRLFTALAARVTSDAATRGWLGRAFAPFTGDVAVTVPWSTFVIYFIVCTLPILAVMLMLLRVALLRRREPA